MQSQLNPETSSFQLPEKILEASALCVEYYRIAAKLFAILPPNKELEERITESMKELTLRVLMDVAHG